MHHQKRQLYNHIHQMLFLPVVLTAHACFLPRARAVSHQKGLMKHMFDWQLQQNEQQPPDAADIQGSRRLCSVYAAVHGTFAPEQLPLVPSNAFQVRCMKRTKGKRSIVGGCPKELQASSRQCQAQHQQLEQVLRLHPSSDAAAATSS